MNIYFEPCIRCCQLAGYWFFIDSSPLNSCLSFKIVFRNYYSSKMYNCFTLKHIVVIKYVLSCVSNFCLPFFSFFSKRVYLYFRYVVNLCVLEKAINILYAIFFCWIILWNKNTELHKHLINIQIRIQYIYSNIRVLSICRN